MECDESARRGSLPARRAPLCPRPSSCQTVQTALAAAPPAPAPPACGPPGPAAPSSPAGTPTDGCFYQSRRPGARTAIVPCASPLQQLFRLLVRPPSKTSCAVIACWHVQQPDGQTRTCPTKPNSLRFPSPPGTGSAQAQRMRLKRQRQRPSCLPGPLRAKLLYTDTLESW
jgi:hypothetical protein